MATQIRTQTKDVLDEMRRILSQTAALPDAPAASACCSTSEQEVCCEASEKDTCCGAEATSGGGCGCR